jgi:outer membrane protein W
MDNKDFDKLLSDKLNETQSFEYMEADWDNVAGRLTPLPKKKRRGGGWLWLFGLGFLFMAATSIYLANTLNKTNKYLVELKTAVAELEQGRASQKNIEKVDTIFKQVIITQYDTLNVATINNQIVPQKSIVRNNSRIKISEENAKSAIISKERNTQELKPENILSIATAKEQSHKQGLTNNNKAIETKTKKATTTETTIETILNNNKVLGIESLWMRSLSYSLLSGEMAMNPIDDFSEVPATVKANKKKKLAWKYLSIGLTGGSFLSRELKNGEEELSNGAYVYSSDDNDFGAIALNNRYGWDVGVVLQYQLGSKVSLTGSAHFQRNIYSGNGGGASALRAIQLFENTDGFLPDETAPELLAEESIRAYTFKQNMITYQLGANYSFRKNKKWRPYLSLSASATSMVKQTLYTDTDGFSTGGINPGYSLRTRTKVAESKTINSSFRFTGIVPAAGFQMTLNPKMSWKMEAWYRQGFNKEKDYLYGLLGLRTGVSYRF